MSAFRKTVHLLARAHGVVPRFRDARRIVRTASNEALLATLRALGVEVSADSKESDLTRAFESLRDERSSRWPQVIVAWDGRCDLAARAMVTLEDGSEARRTDPIPFGYHRVHDARSGDRRGSLLISAPRRLYRASERPAWGVFAPLYALRGAEGRACGDLGDLDRLVRWTAERGGAGVATLPLLAIDPADPDGPSPYRPLSRIAWNSLFVDLEAAPELRSSPRARDTLQQTRAAERAMAERSVIDVAAIDGGRRRVLALLSETLFNESGVRRNAFEAWRRSNGDASEYAEARGDGDGRVEIYAQWLFDEQLAAVAESARQRGVTLAFDMPLGVHPRGFDVARHSDLFVTGVSAGAPPDSFFASGQSWGSPPLHPRRDVEALCRYFAASLAHLMRHAGALRIDHVMGLDRQYWIPDRCDPLDGDDEVDGAYVRYPSEMLYAVLSIESHRAQCAVIGEDLGTVPRYVRSRMKRHGLLSTHVMSTAASPPPADSVACFSTHDMPTFAGAREGATFSELEAMLDELGRSAARLVTVALEDLWLETARQNVPGTTDATHPNWRRRMRRSIAEIEEDSRITSLLDRLTAARGRI